jgi:hypothetical protein
MQGNGKKSNLGRQNAAPDTRGSQLPDAGMGGNVVQANF